MSDLGGVDVVMLAGWRETSLNPNPLYVQLCMYEVELRLVRL